MAQLDQHVHVSGVGVGWIAIMTDRRVTIEFPHAESVVVPRSHLETDLYDLR